MDCGGRGHWKGDAACPKVQSGETPPFVPKKKDQKGRDVGAVEADNGLEREFIGDEDDRTSFGDARPQWSVRRFRRVKRQEGQP